MKQSIEARIKAACLHFVMQSKVWQAPTMICLGDEEHKELEPFLTAHDCSKGCDNYSECMMYNGLKVMKAIKTNCIFVA